MFEVLSACCALMAVAVLAAVIMYVVVNGARALNFDFFTQVPAPVGEPGGGIANAIVGTLIIVGIGALLSIPSGVLAGIYVAEYGDNRFADLVRFLGAVLTGIPSIVVGILAYALVVVTMQKFSALAGGVALAVLMLPTVVRATEEMLRLVPGSLREASLALGAPRWKTILRIVLPTASSGLATGAMLAIARAAGETAPLLFTAFGNSFWNTSLVDPMAAIPLQVFQYAISPYESWRAQAWAGALVLVVLVLGLSAAVRVIARPLQIQE
ncbi:MAG: phosphate ABC transporter permease PstA [Chloroflexi bacterium]|nr:phosphate ABC transporter permease PstA [Chloroflexota bacterium]